MRRYVVGVVVVVVVAAIIVILFRISNDSAEPSGLPLPDSMAAIGDSITQAVAVNQNAFGSAAQHSWATGNDDEDVVVSHYERLAQAHPAITGNVFNNSVPGAKMADALAQADITVSQQPDHVIFLMGANDVCAAEAASMTSTTDFENRFKTALDRLTGGLPDASIYVVSIPDIFRLWEVQHESLLATTIWANAGICRAMLSDNEDDREEARERNAAFNEILERVCGTYERCRYDGNAVYDHEFSPDEIGPLDHFHPSEQGQAALAEVSWENGYWPDH